MDKGEIKGWLHMPQTSKTWASPVDVNLVPYPEDKNKVVWTIEINKIEELDSEL